MKRRFIPYTACPECQGPFAVCVEREDGEEILEGALVCPVCQARVEVTRGIPRFSPAELSTGEKATAAAFGYEWTHYADLSEQYREEFLDWIKPVGSDFFAGRVVLDAGCGKGRHAHLAAQFGARDVIGVDLSDAVEAAFPNTRSFPNIHIVQADLSRLPFLPPVDYVYCIGVLHHLPDPKRGFLALVEHLKPGGRISIWVYGKEGNQWIEKLVTPFRMHVTSKLPKLLTRVISFGLAMPLYASLKLVYGPVQRRPGLATVKRNLPYADYLCSIAEFSFKENLWNVFDHLVAPTASYHSREEVADWMAAAKLEEVEITPRNNNSWRATGVKPLAEV